MASSVTIWPATSSSSNSFCTAGISLDFSSISICASTSAVSTANARLLANPVGTLSGDGALRELVAQLYLEFRPVQAALAAGFRDEKFTSLLAKSVSHLCRDES